MNAQKLNTNPKNLTIFLVDDDPIFIMLQSRIIKVAGYEFEKKEFPDGSKALECLNENIGTTDSFLIFLDINMPVMDGWEFLDAIQDHPLQKQIKVVIVTSSVSPTDKIKAQSYKDVISFIEKPITVAHIHELFKLPELQGSI